MTRNRDNMNWRDLVWVCARSGTVIVTAMVLLGSMMIAHKPEVKLELAASPMSAPVAAREADDGTIVALVASEETASQ